MAKPAERSFEGSPDRVYAALLGAISSAGYSITNSDRDSRIVSFETPMSMRSWGGQAMSITVRDAGSGQAVAVAGGVRRGGFQFGKPPQIYDWGEKTKIAEKLFDKTQELLPTITVTATPPPGRSLSDELEQLAHLHETGVLSNEQFEAAKAKIIG